MSDENPFPNWGKPVQRGDVLQLAIKLYALVVAQASFNGAVALGDKDEIRKQYNNYNDAVFKYSKWIDEYGGDADD